MKEKDLHKLIREKSSGDNTELVNALMDKHPELAGSSEKSSDRERNKKIAARRRAAVFARLATVAVLAVIVSPTLLLKTEGGETSPSPSNTPSGLANKPYTMSDLYCTVQEYNDLYNTNFLFFEWEKEVEFTAFEYNYRYYQGFLGLDYIYKGKPDRFIEYQISADDNTLDFLKKKKELYINRSTVMNIRVEWMKQDDKVRGFFEFGGYSYYLTLNSSSDESRLFELVEELLLSQK